MLSLHSGRVSPSSVRGVASFIGSHNICRYMLWMVKNAVHVGMCMYIVLTSHQLHVEDFPRIHDSKGIERGLDFLHDANGIQTELFDE